MNTQKQRTIKNKLLFVVILSALLAAALSFSVNAAYLNASITRTTTGAIQNVYYYTSGNGYKDNVGNTPDVNLTVCADTSGELTSKKVAAFYLVGANDSSLLLYEILGGDSVARFISLGAPYASGSDYCAQANFEFFAGRSPYPAAVFAVVDTNNNNTGSTFDFGTDAIIPITTSNGYLRGSYSFSNVQTTYSQTTGNVSVNPTAATAYTSSSTTTSPSQDSDTKLMLGVCEDSQGVNCTGTIQTSLDASAKSLYTGIVSPADTTIYYRYAVANGLSTQFCIGPNLDITTVSASPSTGPPGTIVNITATIQNQNTVDVTQSYNISFYYDSGNLIGTQTLIGLADGASKQTSVIWNTSGIGSGSHPLSAKLTDTGIGDCDNSDDNATGSFSTELVYFPYVWIDGVQNNTFPYPGRPHNVTIQINDSDGNVAANVTVQITEENGLSLIAPTQTFTVNGNKRGVKPVSTAEVITDNSGTVNLALIPTGNKLYTSAYSYTNISDHVGNYSLYFEIFNSSGSELQLYYNNQKVGEFNFTLQSQTAVQPNSTERYSLDVLNENTYVKAILNFIHQVRTTASLWI